MKPSETNTKLEGVESRDADVTPGREGQPTPASSPALPSSSGASHPSGAGESAAKEVGQTAASQLAEEARRLSAKLERIAEWFQRDSVAEAARLVQLDKDLRERQTAIEQAQELYRDSAEIKRQADAQAQEIQRMMADARSREAAAQKVELQAREERSRIEQTISRAYAEQEHAKRLQLESEAQLRKALAAQADAKRLLSEVQRLDDEAQKLQRQVLPIAFRGEPWRAWREELIRRAASEGPVSLLIARLHAAAALERSGRPLPMELVRDIGRSVYETYSSHAEKIGQALTQDARGQFDIKTVRVGDRVDNKFMKPSASGLVEVHAVSGWAVRDAKGIWQFLAEVS